MRRSQLGLGMLNVLSITCLLLSCSYLSVQSESSFPISSRTEGTLTLVETDDDNGGMVNSEEKSFTHDELKKALIEFKVDQVDSVDSEGAEAVKKKFKRYEALKEDMDDIEMDIQMNGEIVDGDCTEDIENEWKNRETVTELVKELSNRDLLMEDKLLVMEELVFFMHKKDNVVMFCDQGGMQLILLELNSTESTIRAMSALIMGTALLSKKPKVQKIAIESGAIQQLIRTLSSDTDSKVRENALYAISSLVRHFPYAQKKFLELGGFSALKTVFSDNLSKYAKERVMTLLDDLIQEQENLSSDDKEKQKQYLEISRPLRSAMVDNGFCSLVPTFLSIDGDNMNEKALRAMKFLLEPCQFEFNTHEAMLSQLSDFYKQLRKNYYDGAAVFLSMNKIIDDLLEKVRLSYKDEL